MSAKPNTESPPAEPLLRVRGLGFKRGSRWLFRNLDFDLAPGEFLALVGPSGVGKTTLLSCLCGLCEPDEGSVETRLPTIETPAPPVRCRHRFGIVYQNLQLTPNADLLTNVLCGRLARYSFLRTLFGFPGNLRSEAYGLLRELGVGQEPTKWACEMSGGEQQRVAIARALFQQPDIYFADEPVSNLDSYYAGRVLGLLRLEADEKQRGVICVLHHAEHIQRFADRALSLNGNDPSACRVREIHPTRPPTATA